MGERKKAHAFRSSMNVRAICGLLTYEAYKGEGEDPREVTCERCRQAIISAWWLVDHRKKIKEGLEYGKGNARGISC